MKKLGFRNVVLSVTLFVAVAYVLCAILYWILPSQTERFAQFLFHGIELKIAPLSFGSFLIGLVEASVVAFVYSAIFVWIYNKVAR